MINFKAVRTFSLIERAETPWVDTEYLVIRKVFERRLWQLYIIFFL